MLEVILAPAPLCVLIRLASASAYPSRSASMSCSDSSRSPCSSPKLHKSVTTLRVNSTLPAPINATLTMRALLHVAHHVNRASMKCALFGQLVSEPLGPRLSLVNSDDGVTR